MTIERTNETRREAALPEGLETRVADPFALDLFASSSPSNGNDDGSDLSRQSAPTTDTLPAVPAVPSWHTRLPRLTREQLRRARLSESTMPALSPLIRQTLAARLAYFTHGEAFGARLQDAVHLEAIDLREADLNAATIAPYSVFINLAVEPAAAPLTFALPVRFAVRLIDRVLGGTPDTEDATLARPMTTIECAAIEFLCLNMIQHLNREIGSNLLRFDGVGEEAPAWLMSGDIASDSKHTTDDTEHITEHITRGIAVVTSVRITVAVECLARGFIPSTTLRALTETNDKLLPDADTSGAHRIHRFKALTSGVGLRIRLGATQLAASDMTQLEDGDVVVTKQSIFNRPHPQVEAFAGDGVNFKLTGNLRLTENQYALHLTEITSDKAMPAKERWHMNDAQVHEPQPDIDRVDAAGTTDAAHESTTNDDVNLEATERLENLFLTVHIELAARRISLDELANLKPDGILELGCRATDPVSLVVEERTIARGELIDIEGQIGVRLTQVMR